MSITSSTIRVYGDEDLQSLVKTINTQGDSDAIDVTGLDEGQTYWATVEVTESGGTSSEESNKYRFYTLPDCDFSFTPFATGTTIYFGVSAATHTVGIRQIGVHYADIDSSARGNDVLSTSHHSTFSGEINGLAEDTIYSITPLVIDEFGRRWVNNPSSVTVKTSVAAPVISISSINMSGNVASGVVNVISNSNITSLEIKLQAEGSSSYISATGYTAQDGLQQFYVSGLSHDTTYTVYATATNAGGSATAQETFTTMSVDAYAILDDCDLEAQHKTEGIYVEISGYVGSGATIETVGAKFFLEDNPSGTQIENIYGQLGETSVLYHTLGLPSGREIYVFGYMDYIVDGVTYTVYSASQSVTTVPTMDFITQSVATDSASGTFQINGDVVTSVSVQYKASTDANWSDATIVNGTSYVIGGLTANTTYYLKGTVANSSGSYETNQITFTTNGSTSAPTVTIGSISNITNEGASVTITITE